MKPMDAKIRAMIDKINAQATKAATESEDEMSEEQLALGEKVTAVLAQMGVSETVLRAKLIAGTDVELPEIDTTAIDPEGIDDDEKDAVIEGTLKILAELGYDLDEDDGQGETNASGKVCAEDLSDDPEEALEEVTAVISGFMVKHGTTPARLAALTTKLNASMKIAGDTSAKLTASKPAVGTKGRAGRFTGRR